jgi:hypothetical protein
MAVLDFARGRAACPSQPSPANLAIGSARRPRPLRIAVEVGETLAVLTLIALGVLALRFALVLAHGFIH